MMTVLPSVHVPTRRARSAWVREVLWRQGAGSSAVDHDRDRAVGYTGAGELGAGELVEGREVDDRDEAGSEKELE
jgi:hypothetical protein